MFLDDAITSRHPLRACIRPANEMTRFPPLCCPEHGQKLVQSLVAGSLKCPQGCEFSVVRNIPRFVDSDNYAAPFGNQWKAFRRTQLDSFTGTHITRDRLTRCLGGSLSVVAGKLVLEAGCGAGRFTELLLEAGATVFACDLSEAVEANFENCADRERYFVCQADIMRLPVQPHQFDYVICLGVIQHTPSPEKTIAALARQLKPGGVLIIDHYTGEQLLRPSQNLIRNFLLKRSPRFSLWFCKTLVTVLWPMHRLSWRVRNTPNRFVSAFRRRFLQISPVLDYHYSYPQLGEELIKAWAILDTHDALADYYKHSRSCQEIEHTLKEIGLGEITTSYGGNGVEARATRAAI